MILKEIFIKKGSKIAISTRQRLVYFVVDFHFITLATTTTFNLCYVLVLAPSNAGSIFYKYKVLFK